MDKRRISQLIEENGLEICGQPKWTFGKNTCNTYELFAEKMRLESGEMTSAWPVLELIEQDAELTLLFSRWFLRAAMNAAVELTRDSGANITLSVNLLPLHASQDNFPSETLALIQETGVSPRKLHFEISEAQTLTSRGIENLNQLRDTHGVGLWLANFGTGYSNADLLREVHFNGLELDRSFAAHIPDHEQTCRVVVAIVHLAHTLDLQVCAKGIENQDQFEFFEELDCNKGQGYLIGKPMDKKELEEYIRKYAVKRKKA